MSRPTPNLDKTSDESRTAWQALHSIKREMFDTGREYLAAIDSARTRFENCRACQLLEAPYEVHLRADDEAEVLAKNASS